MTDSIDEMQVFLALRKCTGQRYNFSSQDMLEVGVPLTNLAGKGYVCTHASEQEKESRTTGVLTDQGRKVADFLVRCYDRASEALNSREF